MAYWRRAMQKNTPKSLRGLYEGEEAPLYTDPTTGEQVIDIHKGCEGLGGEQLLAKLDTRPNLKDSL